MGALFHLSSRVSPRAKAKPAMLHVQPVRHAPERAEMRYRVHASMKTYGSSPEASPLTSIGVHWSPSAPARRTRYCAWDAHAQCRDP